MSMRTMKNADILQILQCTEEELSEIKLAFRDQLVTTLINNQPAIILTPTELEEAGPYETQMWANVSSQNEKFAAILSGERWGQDLPHGFEKLLRKVQKKITMDFSAGLRAKLKKVKERREAGEDGGEKERKGGQKTKQVKGRKREADEEEEDELAGKKKRKMIEVAACEEDDADEADDDEALKPKPIRSSKAGKGGKKSGVFASASASTTPIVKNDSKRAPSRPANAELKKGLPAKHASRAKRDDAPGIFSNESSPSLEVVQITKPPAIQEAPAGAAEDDDTVSVVAPSPWKPQDENHKPTFKVQKTPTPPAQAASSNPVPPALKALLQETITIAVHQSEARILARMEQKFESLCGGKEKFKEEIKKMVLKDLVGGLQ